MWETPTLSNLLKWRGFSCEGLLFSIKISIKIQHFQSGTQDSAFLLSEITFSFSPKPRKTILFLIFLMNLRLCGKLQGTRALESKGYGFKCRHSLLSDIWLWTGDSFPIRKMSITHLTGWKRETQESVKQCIQDIKEDHYTPACLCGVCPGDYQVIKNLVKS